MVIDPPSVNGTPAAPELPRASVKSASGVKAMVSLPPEVVLVRFEPVVSTLTVILLVPVTWYWAEVAVPEQTTTVASQPPRTPAFDTVIVREPASGRPLTIVPKSRLRWATRVSGLTILAEALAFGVAETGAAKAGVAASVAAAASAARRTNL